LLFSISKKTSLILAAKKANIVIRKVNLNEMIALKKSFLIFELIDSINKFKRKKIIITYLDKIGARFISMEINVAKTVIENIEFFIKLFSQ
tara:strand:+ start:78 stop:350 length:273 start_codon:yes stop_codon:yes gene_type:complete